jgi:hypothetical protein
MAYRIDSLATRLRSGLCLLAGLAIATCLLAALATDPAAAHPGPALPSITPFEIEVDEVAEISDEEAGEDEEWEEEEEEEEESEEEGLSALPSECVLYTATARVTALTRANTVRLSIRYASYEPARSTIDYWLKGGEGSLQLKASKRYLSKKGQLHSVEHLSARAMEKVQAARVFVVHIDTAATPPHCDRYSTLRLTSKHQAGQRTSWSEPPSGTQPLRR